jgi:hypothetical protein
MKKKKRQKKPGRGGGAVKGIVFALIIGVGELNRNLSEGYWETDFV